MRWPVERVEKVKGMRSKELATKRGKMMMRRSLYEVSDKGECTSEKLVGEGKKSVLG